MIPNMDKLNLPILKADIPFSRSLSMEDYIKFVTLNLRYTIDRKAIREQKKLAVVNEHFSLKKSLKELDLPSKIRHKIQ